MSEKVIITTKVLKWARESARISVKNAAARLHLDERKIEEWENGISYPTMRQLETLAKAYKRPLAIFFLPDIPRDFTPLQDFRSRKVILSTASVFIIREVQQRQAWTSEIFKEDDHNPLPFVGKFSIEDDAKKVAIDILNTLNIDPQKYSFDNPLLEWVTKAEANGIFISRTSFINSHLKLDSEELQGFAIADKYAPFIFINSEDWDAPQLFTIVHELAHIWIAASGISNELDAAKVRLVNMDPIEIFCNEVAANALMPESYMKQCRNAFVRGKDVFGAAKKIGVSSFAFLVRALKLQIITEKQYKQLKKEAEKVFNEYVAKEEEKMMQMKAKQKALPPDERSGPSYYVLQSNRVGQLFSRIVLDAYRVGAIPPTEASQLLNIKVNNFPKLEAALRR